MNIRNCARAKAAIDRRLDGRSAPAEIEALEAHLRRCLPCRDAARIAEEARVLFEMERGSPRPTLPDGFAERVRAGLHGEVFRTALWGEVIPTIRRLSLAAGLVAAATFAAAGTALWQRPPATSPVFALVARGLNATDRYLLVPGDSPSPDGIGIALLEESRR